MMHPLTQRYFELLDFVLEPQMCKKMFRHKSDEYAKQWSRSSIDDQGLIAEEISSRLKLG